MAPRGALRCPGPRPVAQADVGRSVGLDPKDLVGVLNDLQAADLVVREPDPKDRRKNAVSLTPEGERLLRRCEDAARTANEALLAPLSAAERERFMALLRGRGAPHPRLSRQISTPPPSTTTTDPVV